MGAVPFAVPGVRLAVGAAALHTDRGTHCALPPPATGGGRARDPKSCARQSHNPESIAPILPEQIKKNTIRMDGVLLWHVAPI